ncbi:hypothetical protein C9374_003493 [Naegleria lovaniensis]|uniref:Uncharacterized protein n=1 Tax=Naegleria lovaniensis TaxID=51637 RepID=A0AA88GTD9_NAELO|nr:uncharacterized protein C9374_003493 [Naegleria lovaniensis]KAG2385678.1 hypothetical protein C9374_003493 [Naegleria lovaniensis]
MIPPRQQVKVTITQQDTPLAGYTEEEYDQLFESGHDLPSWDEILRLVGEMHHEEVKNSVDQDKRLKECYEKILQGGDEKTNSKQPCILESKD